MSELNLPIQFFLVFPEILLFLVSAIIYFLLTKESIVETLRFKKVPFKTMFIAIAIGICSQPIAILLSLFSQLMFPNDVSQLFLMMDEIPFVYKLMIIAVVPALCEEIFSRGVALKGYDEVHIVKASLMNGLIFGIMHLNGQQFLYAFVLGSIFAYIVRVSGSIFTSMIAHFTVNGIQVTMAEISMKVSKLSIKYGETSGQPADQISGMGLKSIPFNTILVAIISYSILACLGGGCIYLLIRELKKTHSYKEKSIDESIKIKIFDKYMINLLILFIISLAADLILG
jgi:membrane protease YdiL (CAAX protease family)